ncbi:MAG: DUF2281 domain-containing protein [Candidatus Kapabacteria bacterium]|nr:DUF2281 domain-containing protein [Candidatus Kapabacteria bacterium]
MNSTLTYSRFSSLPHSLRNEANNYIEFLVLKHNKNNRKKHPKAGCMKGIFTIQPDFNEPLEDFKDYM